MKIISRDLPLFVILLLMCPVSLPVSVAAAEGGNGGALSSGLDELAYLMTEKLDQKKTYKVAVSDFVDLEGNVTNLGRYIAEELNARLFRLKMFQVIERRMLDPVLQEQKLTMTGLVDTAASKKVGSLLGLDGVITGSISDLGGRVKVNGRMIDTESGQVLTASFVEIQKDDRVNILLGKSVTGVVENGDGTAEVIDTFIGLWFDNDDEREYYYEIRKNGFVFYCEIENGEVVDLDTGIINGSTVTYSGGDQENVSYDIAESERVEKLPELCH